MTRSRDSQRKKFRTAFNAFDKDLETTSREGMQLFVDSVIASRWWGNRSELRRLRVSPMAPARVDVLRNDMWRMRVPPVASKAYLLMQMCHAAQSPTSALHGPEYCRLLLEAIERFVDKETADKLRGEFRVNRVKLRSWSPEAREAARFRHAKKELLLLADDLAGESAHANES